jgi:mannan endo-1,4-beta-mannosidase
MSHEGQLLRRTASPLSPAFAPTADVDTVTTDFGTVASVNALANDVTWGGATLNPATLDLDPATAGVQNTLSSPSGSFTAADDGAVTFTPAQGFTGKAVASYSVRDSRSRQSNVVDLTVIVKPDPGAAIPIGDFETGTDGFVARNWNAAGGVVESSTDWASSGTHSLKVTVAGDWIGKDLATPLDLSQKSVVKLDLKTLPAAGSSVSIALQVGPASTWCQGPFTWYPQDGTYQVSLDMLTGLGCTSPDLTQIHGIDVFFNAGTFYVDNLRAE